jgi:hypothetical protein
LPIIKNKTFGKKILCRVFFVTRLAKKTKKSYLSSVRKKYSTNHFSPDKESNSGSGKDNDFGWHRCIHQYCNVMSKLMLLRFQTSVFYYCYKYMYVRWACLVQLFSDQLFWKSGCMENLDVGRIWISLRLRVEKDKVFIRLMI